MHHTQRLTLLGQSGVRVVQPLARVGHDPQGDVPRHPLPTRPRAAHDAAQVLAVNELHGDEVGAVLFAELVDLRDVRVVEAGDDLRLVQEHLNELRVLGEVRQDSFDHYVAVEALDAGLLCKPHLSHATGGQLLDVLVLAGLHLRARDCSPRALEEEGRIPSVLRMLRAGAPP